MKRALIIVVMIAGAAFCFRHLLPANYSAQTVQSIPEIMIQRNIRVSDNGGPFLEPCVSAYPNDPNVLVVSSSEVVKDGILATAFVTRDGGRAWTRSPLPEMRESLARREFVHALDTWSTVAPNGIAYVSALAAKRLDDGRWQTPIVVYRSTDRGQNWQGPTLIPGRSFDRPSIVATRDKVFIEAVASGKDTFVVKQPISADVVSLLSSDDQGGSFQSMGYVAPDNLGRNSLNASLLPDDSVLLSYFDHPRNEGQRLTGGRLYIVKAMDGGRALGLPQFVADVNRASNPGQIAVDRSTGPFRGRVYAAWEGGSLMYLNPSNVRASANSGKSREVAIAYSTDEGLKWSTPVILRGEESGPAYYANVVVNHDGVVGLAWLQHERSQPERLCYRVYFAASLDGGKTFTSPRLVSDAVSCPDSKDNLAITYPPVGEQMVERFPRGGDYIGLTAAADGSFHPVWIDGRNGIFQVYTARIEARRSEKADSK